MSERDQITVPEDAIPGWKDWQAEGMKFSAFAYAELDVKRLAIASRLFWPAMK